MSGSSATTHIPRPPLLPSLPGRLIAGPQPGTLGPFLLLELLPAHALAFASAGSKPAALSGAHDGSLPLGGRLSESCASAAVQLLLRRLHRRHHQISYAFATENLTVPALARPL